jgi:hypothetical protein
MNCKNCGAPIEISGYCSYCKSYYKGEYTFNKFVDSVNPNECITVVSQCKGKLNLSTGGFGRGEIYTFLEFGQVLQIYYKDLKEIVKNNRSFYEQGLFAIVLG